ncbi:phage integrase central domain-containing protein, partial [Bartonella rattaustraliani]|uniref:phage integrase central domain-containing protein n=1 Tax=Bartonella rattaustraliani TaxID=481139 RepID=UPI000477CA78
MKQCALFIISKAVGIFESCKAELKDDDKSGDWFSSLQRHVLPKLGRLPISEITQTEIRNTLAPIWHTKAGTA